MPVIYNSEYEHLRYGDNVIKHFTAVIYEWARKAKCPWQASPT